MADYKVTSLRLTETRAAQVAALERLTGLAGVAAVVDFALASTLAQYKTGGRAMQSQEERGEELYEAATGMAISEALENYGSAEAVAQAVVEMVGHGDPADVVAYIEAQ